jgi:hypothetical protein
MIDLNKYQRRVYSQSGEDGILEKIFESLNINEGWFCEFGAGDGNNISNTRIFREKGWSGVLIEGDTDRFNKMNKAKEIASNKNIHLIKEYISCEPGEKIDDLLSNTPIPKDFDLVSIDIDGNDLWIWKSMEKYRPKVVIIEYNSHFPVTESVTVKYDRNHRFEQDNYYGANAGALIKLGKEKSYDLVGYTNGLNLIFVDSNLSSLFRKVNTSEIDLHIGWPPSQRKMVKY